MKRPLMLLMNPDGTPAKIELAMRPSTSAPGRVKAVFATKLEEGAYIHAPNGTAKIPSAMVQLAENEKLAIGSEFRIEVTS